jgi:predicted DNA repair protein MutK
MPSSGLLKVLDDIVMVLDDVAAMSKLAAKKTAGLVGDDLAVNANVVVGLEPARELPIVGKIALGSLANKFVLVPLALVLPSKVIGPLLMLGGAFLCYEAAHKLAHKKNGKEKALPIPLDPQTLAKMEKEKVMGAIGTDTILSAEVIAIALGAVAHAPLLTKALTLSVVGLAMTIGVYGLVALIVKLDDLGLYWQRSKTAVTRRAGQLLVVGTPKFMKLLSVLGTLAMFLVGGEILLHGIPALHHWVVSLGSVAMVGGVLKIAASLLFGCLVGFLCAQAVSLLGFGSKASPETQAG